MRMRHPPGQRNARQPGLAVQATGIQQAEAPSSEQKRTAGGVKYSPLLPLVPAMLTDAWPEEVIQSLLVHRALKALLAALAAQEGGAQ